MTTYRDRLLAALVILPGVAFAAANSTASPRDASPIITAVGAVGLSGAVGAGVVLKPCRATYGIAFGWSCFSVIFELLQAKSHHGSGADGRAAVSMLLGGVRLTGAVIAGRAATAAATPR